MDVDKELINSKAITEFLGLRSNIYIQSINHLKEQLKKEKLYEEKFLKWKEIFCNFYGYEITSELFLNHTYFTHVLKVIKISILRKSIKNIMKIT